MSSKHPFEDNLNDCLRQNRLPFKQSKAEAWQNIENRIESGSKVFPVSRNRFTKIAAAVAVLIAGLSILYYLSGSTDFENSGSGIATVNLPDGSAVDLNENAHVHYNTASWSFNRSVDLSSGEAFFRVEKGQSFTVHTSKGDVTVLGTSFNVMVNDQGLEVACKSGSVEVKMGDASKAVILTPGEKVQSGENVPVIRNIPTNEIGAWAKGDFIFNNVAIADVFNVVEGQTGYTIDINPDINVKYSGQFNKSQSLKEILDIVCLPADLTYSIDKKTKQILISKN